MAKILVIGGCGYIGTRLVKYLRDNKHDVDTIDLEWFGNRGNNNTVLDYGKLTRKDIMKYKTIVLLAGHSSVAMCKNNMLSCTKNNVLNFINLLTIMHVSQRLIYASSSSVYGDTKDMAVTEEHNNYSPNNYYDLTKYEIDSYAKLSGVEYYGLRFGTVNGYSPNLRNDIMINAMVSSAKDNGVINVYNPDIWRPILGILDLCRAVETIINSKHDNRGIYNLASFNMQVKDIGESISTIMEVPLKIHTDATNLVLTNTKLQSQSYNFSIVTKKFEDTFNFEFTETVNTIVDSLIVHWDTMSRGNRNVAVKY